MGQEAGEKWTAAAKLQPTFPKSDRLLGKIIWVNILLSGDNAVVIALAARSLPDSQRRKAVIFGSAAAIALRVVLTIFAVQLLHYPYLKIVGALLLLGLGLSIPLIIVGSQLLMAVMERFPSIITLGAGLLGFVAGEMLMHDQALASLFGSMGATTTTTIELAAAVGVVLLGQWLARRKGCRSPSEASGF